MALSSTTSRVDYTGNGAVSSYAYTYKIFDKTHLSVTVRATDDTEYTPVVDTDYTVSGVDSPTGGSITFVYTSQAYLNSDSTLKNGYALSIQRVLPLTQATDIRNQGSYFPETHEKQFDRFIMIDQQQQAELRRSLRVPQSEVGGDVFILPEASERANRFLAFDADGEPYAASSTGGIPVTPFMETLLDDPDASTARATLGDVYSPANPLNLPEVATPATPAAGYMKVYPKSDGKLYTLNDDGTETQVGSGAGGINYISANPDAESGTTGWATYADAAGTAPVDGTGGSPAVTWTRTTSSPLRGTGSFLLTKDASNRQGQGASFDFTIASADKCKPLTISFEYDPSTNFVAGSDSATGDVVVYIYDVTNSALIQPAGYKLVGGSTGGPWKFSGTFQASTSTSYRLILHIAGTTSSAWTLKVDTVNVGPSAMIVGAAITDWQAYTPTLGAGFGTATGVDFYWRRAGDSIQIKGDLTTGTVAASATSITLPSGLSIDPTKVDDIMCVGVFARSGTGAAMGVVLANGNSGGAGVNLLTLGRQDASTIGLSSQNGSSILSNTERIGFVTQFFPISGWGSSVVMSTDTDTRVVAARAANGSSTAVNPGPTKLDISSISYDTHGTMSAANDNYVCPVAGKYQIKALVQFGSNTNFNGTTERVLGTIYKNGSVYSSPITMVPVSASVTYRLPIVDDIDCVAGDTLEIRFEQESGSTLNVVMEAFAVARISGPATVAATETVSASYQTAAAPSISNSGSDVIVDFATKSDDSHSAVTTGASWKFTAPTSGRYLVAATIEFTSAAYTAGNQATLTVYKNGTLNRLLARVVLQASVTMQLALGGSTEIRLLAGDTVDIRAANNRTAGNTALRGDAEYNHVSIVRVGNY